MLKISLTSTALVLAMRPGSRGKGLVLLMTREFRPTNPAGAKMNEVMQSVWAGLGALVPSDLGPVPSPLWHVVVTGQMAHVLIGVSLALFRTRALLVWGIFGCWLLADEGTVGRHPKRRARIARGGR